MATHANQLIVTVDTVRALVSEPVAMGEPGAGYPLPWSVQTATHQRAAWVGEPLIEFSTPEPIHERIPTTNAGGYPTGASGTSDFGSRSVRRVPDPIFADPQPGAIHDDVEEIEPTSG